MERKMSFIDNSQFSTYYTNPCENGSHLPPLSVGMAGDEQCSANYRLYRYNSDLSVLIYVQSGSGYLEMGGTITPLHTGDLLTLPQGSTYGYYVNREKPWHILWFNMTGELYPYLLNRYGLTAYVYREVEQAVVNGFRLAMELCRNQENFQQVQDGLCSIVYEILLALWRQYLSPTGKDTLAGQLRRLLDERLSADHSSNFTIDTLARSLGASIRQLEREFKQTYEVTPCRYFQQQKLLLAKQYLSSTALSIKEISGRLGFCDPYYFSGCFKAQEGLSPRDFRNRESAHIEQATQYTSTTSL